VLGCVFVVGEKELEEVESATQAIRFNLPCKSGEGRGGSRSL
jgi:hypothetical protein